MKITHYTFLSDHGHYFSSIKGTDLKNIGLDDLYKQLGIDYPKFYKMDPLSKLGFLLCEGLTENEQSPSSGIFIWNKHSSFDADLKHTENMKNNLPGPANFTYTLPNIVLGEVAIRHKITGECGVFIADKPDFTQIAKSISIYLDRSSVKNLWVGWMDAKGEKCIGFMCNLIKDTPNIDIFSAELENIYNRLFI